MIHFALYCDSGKLDSIIPNLGAPNKLIYYQIYISITLEIEP